MPTRIHPWQEWVNGGRQTIHRGEDFHKEAHEMAKSIRWYARHNGMKAKARVKGDSVTFQFFEGDETAK